MKNATLVVRASNTTFETNGDLSQFLSVLCFGLWLGQNKTPISAKDWPKSATQILAKIGQTRMAKVGLAKVGHNRLLLLFCASTKANFLPVLTEEFAQHQHEVIRCLCEVIQNDGLEDLRCN